MWPDGATKPFYVVLVTTSNRAMALMSFKHIDH